MLPVRLKTNAAIRQKKNAAKLQRQTAAKREPRAARMARLVVRKVPLTAARLRHLRIAVRKEQPAAKTAQSAVKAMQWPGILRRSTVRIRRIAFANRPSCSVKKARS
jgi:hypothetical protein